MKGNSQLSRSSGRGASNSRKYGNKPTNGYASKREANLAANLHALASRGIIRDLREQVVHQLVPKEIDGGVAYRSDFEYIDSAGQKVIMDAKGVQTDVYKIKKKLMKWLEKVEITEV